MSGIPDTWGSPAYHLLIDMCKISETCHQRYEDEGREPDLDQAIAGFGGVLEVARNVDVRSAAANGLGASLWSRYELHGRPADLDGAVGLFRDALAMYPDEEAAHLADIRTNLAEVLVLRWRSAQSYEDLKESIDAIRASLAATAPGSAKRCSRLSTLANNLLAQYTYAGDSSAITEAVEVYREAVRSAPPGTDVTLWTVTGLVQALKMLAIAIGDRDRTILDEAVEQARTVLAVGAAHQLRPRFQSNLAIVLITRFQTRGRPADLAEAAKLAQDAVDATPAGHPNLAERLSCLTLIRTAEYARAVKLKAAQSRSAAEAKAPRGNRPPTHPSKWLRRQDRGPSAESLALDRLLRTAAALVAAVPEGHVLRPDALLRRATALRFKGVAKNDSETMWESIHCYHEVALDPLVPAGMRISAAKWSAALLLAGGRHWDLAMAPFELAVGLLHRTAPRRVTHADRERGLAEFAGLACDAAACAVRLEKPELALQLLEHGRGVLLGQALDSRTELTDLREQRPELAARFEALRSALDSPEASGFSADTAQGDGISAAALSGEHRHALAGEWEGLVDAIRELPGLHGFMRPPQIEDLLSVSSGCGPIAVVNVSGWGCDALLITDGQVKALALPGLGQGELVLRAEVFRAAVARVRHSGVPDEERESAKHEIHETLTWLWECVAEPVLEALGIPRPAEEIGQSGLALPRLWWVPTGALTTLPLHAAGLRDTAGACVLDRVVSSYAPTVRSLVTAWNSTSRESSQQPEPPEPLIVALPTAPGVPDLPRVDEEVAGLTARFPKSHVLTGAEATRPAVLNALARHRWVHFACHGVSSADGAATSHLVLYDHASAPLTVADIARLRLDDAEIAYLSACDTSTSRGDLADEALHITGACHMAGYRHVVGSLWGVQDTLAPDLAEGFYATLGAAGPGAAAAGRALHDSVGKIRAACPGSPDLWAPYIHVGP
jgi:CHAT domain